MNSINAQTDRQIDLALHTIGSAAPREGMDQRLLARLENRAAAPASSWRPLLTFTPPAVALLAVAVLLLVFHASRHITAPAISEPTTTAANQPTPQQTQPYVASPAHHFSVSAPIASNSARTDPAYLPSFPAPPVPLTTDERRLLLIAQHAYSYDVAQLEAPPQPLPHQRQEAISDYIHHMLAPLITAESYSPTPAVEHDPPLPARTDPQPDSNSSSQ
jgi:hypothetical protein